MRLQSPGSLFLLLALVPSAGLGQTFSEISGFVRDPSGRGVPNAAVRAVSQETGLGRSAMTGPSGEYAIPALLPGSYRVSVSADGFRAAAIEGLRTSLGSHGRADFQLEVGPVEQAVEVVAPRALLQRDSAEVATVLSGRQLVELPSLERNYTSLLGLASNAATEMEVGGLRSARQGGERSELGVAVSGQRQEFNRFLLDGVENTDVNFNSYSVRPSIDALAEVKIQTGIYSAEYGRSVAQIVVGTKSGTNELHGALFEFHRNDDFNALPWRTNREESPLTLNQFGGVVGGPIVRNRAFFLGNVELRRRRAAREAIAFVPSAAMRGGDFRELESSIHDPATRRLDAAGDLIADLFPNQQIPTARMHPAALALLEFYSEPNTADPVINYRRSFSSAADSEQYLQRFDFNESDGSRWFARFSHGAERSAGPSGAFPTEARRVDTTTYQLAVSNTRSLGPRGLNELRVGYNRFRNDSVGYFGYRRDVVAELGIPGLRAPDPSAWGVPSIRFAEWSPFGTSTNGPWSNRDHLIQLGDVVSAATRGHSLKFGARFRRDYYDHVGGHSSTGAFSFSGDATADPRAFGATGDSFADLLLGAPAQADRIIALYDARLRASSWSFFFQDTWRVARKLTVDWGLRYEYTPPYYDARNGIINAQVFDMGVGPGGLLEDTRTPVLTRPGDGDFYDGLAFRYADDIPVQAGDHHLGRHLVGTDGNDWAPRLGLAFSPSKRWVVRSGFGAFYSQDIGQPRFEMSRNLSGLDRVRANRNRPDVDLGDPWSFSRRNAACSDWDGVCLTRPFLFNNIPSRRTPYVLQWMFDVQQQLTDSVMLQVGYQGSGGRKLERMRPFNQAVNRSGPTDRSSVTARRPWPVYNVVQEVDGVVNSSYHALTVRAEKRFSSGFTFLSNYTWSKSIDSGSAIRNAGGDRLFPLDNYDLRRERGLSQFHVGRRLVTSFLYELPFGPGRSVLSNGGLLGSLIAGWQLGGILSFSDGPPVNTGAIGDRNATGVGNYPDATGVSPILDNPTIARYWNIDAFDSVNPELLYREGNLGRTVLPTPGLVNWDASLLRNIAIGKTGTLQLRIEGYNAANHPNWVAPDTNLRNVQRFGRVVGARTMRSLQFGIKYLF